MASNYVRQVLSYQHPAQYKAQTMGVYMKTKERPRSRSRHHRGIVPFLYLCVAVLGVVATLTTTGCAKKGGGPGQGQGGFAFPVAAAPVRRGDIAEYGSVTSLVTPKLSAALSSVASGTVTSVGAQIGERVSQGELLVEIDDSTLRAQQSQAAANLAQVRANTVGGSTTAQASLESARVAYVNAQANLRRNQTLYDQGYVSKSALDAVRDSAAAATAAYRAAQVTEQNANLSGDDSAAVAAQHNAEAALNAVSAQVAQTKVRAPFDGIVTARNVDPGALNVPGTVLMEVGQLDPVYVNAGISGEDLHFVHRGTPVIITVAALPGREWRGAVEYLNLAANPGTLVYQARIPIANPDLTLRGGAVATVKFARAKKTGVLLAPRAAVYETPAGYSMFIIDSGKAKEVPVDVGIMNDEVAEVTAPGLKPGVQAILNHSPLLQPGTPVQVLPPQPPAAASAAHY
jgi:multidrug resistance efflux pump